MSTCTARRVVLLLALLALGCAPLTVAEEQQLGFQFERQMRSELPLVRDRAVVDYVRDMGEGIVAAAGPQPFQYRFYVVLDKEINAFAGPAGHVYIHTQTILRARNASELAGVIAHEVGHVAERHIAENYNRSRNAQIGTDILALGASVLAGGMVGQAAGLGSSLAAMTWLNSFGREAELDADRFAVETMARAGWNPEGLVSFFQLLVQEGGSGVPTFLSSHPATENRVEVTREEIAKLGGVETLRTHDSGRFEIIQRRIELLIRNPYRR